MTPFFMYILLVFLAAWMLTTNDAYSGSLTRPVTISINDIRIVMRKKRIVNLKTPKYCNVNYEDKRSIQNDPNLIMIYFVTPTYPRPEQVPHLTRLSHTLMHVPRVHWILADDTMICSKSVRSILMHSGLPYTHILSPKPNFGKGKPLPAGVTSRGVANRRAALDWIRQNVHKGLLYFGDDDNTYDLKLFKEIRKTKKLSMFPVGLVGNFGVSSPVFHNNSFLGFFDSWYSGRKFPVDMAGFAVNIQHLRRTATMPFTAGMLEDGFLRSSGFDVEDIEPLADNCTKVLVWHTQTMKNKNKMLRADVDYLERSKYKNLATLLDNLSKVNVLQMSKLNGINSYIIRNSSKISIGME